jgi:hypothetical protein
MTICKDPTTRYEAMQYPLTKYFNLSRNIKDDVVGLIRFKKFSGQRFAREANVDIPVFT